MLWLAYKITIKSSNGQTLHINVPGCGLMGSLDPINGVDVTVSTSHSVNQIGDSIDSQTVGGVLRTISGECQTVAAAKQLLAALPPFASGRLILNDRYFCEFVVKKSPYVVRTKGSLNGRTFSAMLYCRLPYWQSVDAVQCVLGGSVPTFRLPVNYSTPHRFGARRPSAFVNVRNSGDFRADYRLSFRSEIGQIVNPYLLNVTTGQQMRLMTTLEPGQEYLLYWKNHHLCCTRTADGMTEDVLSVLDDDSTLFHLDAGDNLLKIGADSGGDNLQSTISFYSVHMGVYPDDF